MDVELNRTLPSFTYDRIIGVNQIEERDALEDIVRAWDTYERVTHDLTIIDYDLDPRPSPGTVNSRNDAILSMHNLNATATNPHVRGNIAAHLAYLGELHLEAQGRPSTVPFRKYLTLTQGGPIIVPTATQFAVLHPPRLRGGCNTAQG